MNTLLTFSFIACCFLSIIVPSFLSSLLLLELSTLLAILSPGCTGLCLLALLVAGAIKAVIFFGCLAQQV